MGFNDISDNGDVVQRGLLHDRLRQVAQLDLHLFLLRLGPVAAGSSNRRQTLQTSGKSSGHPLNLGLQLRVKLPRRYSRVASSFLQVHIRKPYFDRRIVDLKNILFLIFGNVIGSVVQLYWFYLNLTLLPD